MARRGAPGTRFVPAPADIGAGAPAGAQAPAGSGAGPSAAPGAAPGDLSALAGHRFLFGVGAMKSATTWLWHQLARHPELAFSIEKEPHFLTDYFGLSDHLSPKNRAATARRIVQNRLGRDLAQGRRLGAWMQVFLEDTADADWYVRIFERTCETRFLCDFSNRYCELSAPQWEQVLAAAGDVRVMYTLRDPLERLWSQLTFSGRLPDAEGGPAPGEIGARQYAALLERQIGWGQVLYGRNYEAFAHHLPRERIRINYQDDIESAPLEVLRGIESWCGLTPHRYEPDALAARVNQQRTHAEIPPAFVEAAKPMVDRAFEDLDRAGLPYPAAWRQRWEDRRAGPSHGPRPGGFDRLTISLTRRTARLARRMGPRRRNRQD